MRLPVERGAVVVLGVLAIPFIRRSTAARRNAEDALRRARDELDLRVKERTAGLVTSNAKLRAEAIERERAAEALRRSEELYRSLVEISPDSITLTDIHGDIVLTNDRAAELFGYASAEEMVGQNAFAFIAPEDRPAAIEQAQPLPDWDSVSDLEFTMIRKDGSTFPAEMNGAVIKDVHGLPSGYISVMRDITQRKRAEEHLKRQIDQLKALRNIDIAITSSLDLSVTLNIFLEEVTTQLSVDAAAVLLVNSSTQVLDYVAGRGFLTDGIIQSHFQIGTGYAGLAASECKTFSVFDLTQIPDHVRAEVLRGENFIFYCVLPLKAHGNVVGVLEIFHRSHLDLESGWHEFLESLSGQAAIAIDNAELFDSVQRSNAELALSYDSTLEGWSHALDLRDKETEGHSQRVTDMTICLAQTLGLSGDDLLQLRRGALLHDIGKMGVPDSILLKPGPLSEEEWVIMRCHPTYAYELLVPIPYLRAALDVPYCHHEKWDGTGYPRGLAGEAIPLSARIFAVVDVWDALMSDRPYRSAWPEENVREHIRSQAGSHFDPDIVKAFLAM